MIAALVAALMPFWLYVPAALPEYDLDTEAFVAEILVVASQPVVDHPSCFCGITP